MIVDSSAVVAIVAREPGFERIVPAIAGASSRRISTVNWFETHLVLTGSRYGQHPDDVRGLFERLRLEPVPFDRDHLETAMETSQRFGRGNHRARLNFGDCMAYATAKLAREPLLYVGDDFALTDVESVL